MTRYPESSEIVFDGHSGCVAFFSHQVRLTQEGKRAVLSYAVGMNFQHDIPWPEFQQLWDALQPLDLSALADSYTRPLGMGDFNGTLTITYRLAGQVFSKTIAIVGVAFAEDAQMQRLYQTLTDFTEAHCRLENQKKTA